MMKKTLLAAAVAVAASTSAYAELKFKPGEDSRFHWDNYETFAKANDLKGETLTVFGPWLGPDKELFESVLAYFAEATGAKVEYAGSGSFEQQVVIDAQAGSSANVSVFPQPGLAADLAAKGFLTPLSDTDKKWLEDNYAAGSSWAKYGTYQGKDGKEAYYAVPFKADVKSLVWYVPENLEDLDIEVPTTMEALKAATQKIVDEGGTPWCIGLGSDAATGWPGTDWVEDMMLRTQKPEVYDQWVANEIPFDSDAVTGAIDEFGFFAKNDKFVDGGAASVSSITWQDSPKGLFQSPPKCYFHHQASFISSFFPKDVVMGEDADFFYMPAYESKPELGKPVLGGGTVFAITKDSKAARAFVEFLKTPIAHEVWMAQSGFLTPHKGVNIDVYGSEALKKQGEILLNATTFRFDASDLMPGKIGAGAFWTAMVDYVGGKNAKTVGKDVQNAWDALKK